MKMNQKIKDKNLVQMEQCSRFDECSANICPLDPETIKGAHLPDEDICPWTIKKRGKNQRGIRTQAPTSVLNVIPESNLKILSMVNQKRWHALYKSSNQEN